MNIGFPISGAHFHSRTSRLENLQVPYCASEVAVRTTDHRPYFAVNVADPSLLAWIMKPINAAVASAGTSSLST